MPRTPSRQHDEPLERTTVRLPRSLWQRARLVAMANDLTFQDFVQDAIAAHVVTFDAPGEPPPPE